MEIKFNCGHCGRRLSAEPEMSGDRLECPDCGGDVVVPDRGSSQQSTVGSGQYWEETESRMSGEMRQDVAIEEPARRQRSQVGMLRDVAGGWKWGVAVMGLLLLAGGVVAYYWMNGDSGSWEVNSRQSAVGGIGQKRRGTVKVKEAGVPEESDGEEGRKSSMFNEEKIREKKGEGEVPYVEVEIVEEKSVESPKGGKWKVEYGDFEMKVGLWRNDVVKVHYSMPLDSDGKALKSASNVVFICPYLPERNFYKHDYHRWWSEVAGYTSFSFDIETKLKEIYDRKKCYYYPESGFHDLVFKVKKILEKRYGLESRNILLAGQSSGAIMAKEFVLKYPFKVDAAAYNGGHRNIYFYNPKHKDARTACLVINTVGDRYNKTDDEFPYFIQTVWATCPPIWKDKGGRFFHHTASPAAWNLIHLFVKGVVDLRSANGGVVPKYKEWPWHMEKDWGRKRRVYFPSKDFMEAWGGIPNGILEKLHNDPSIPDRESVCLIPKAGAGIAEWRKKFGGSAEELGSGENDVAADGVVPKGVVIYIGDPAEDGKKKSVSMIDTLYYFYVRGYAACGLRVTKDKKKSFRRIARLIKLVSLNADWKKIPKYVVGLGVGGELAGVAALRYGERIERFKDKIKKGKVTFFKKRVSRHPLLSGIMTVNSRYSTKNAYTSIRKSRGKSELPLTMIYSADFAKLAPRKLPKRTKVVKMKVKGYTLGKKWFETIAPNSCIQLRSATF